MFWGGLGCFGVIRWTGKMASHPQLHNYLYCFVYEILEIALRFTCDLTPGCHPIRYLHGRRLHIVDIEKKNKLKQTRF